MYALIAKSDSATMILLESKDLSILKGAKYELENSSINFKVKFLIIKR